MKKLLPICAALAVFPAFADSGFTPKVFVGGNLGVTGVAWSDEAEDAADLLWAELPTAFWGLGAEIGIRLDNPNKIYNFGFTGAYDYVFDAEIDVDDTFVDANVGFSALSLTFDNYIRVVKTANYRGDIVAGIGVARATERMEVDIPGTFNYDYKGDGNAVILKVGYDWGITDHLDLMFTGRWFIPTTSESDADALFTASIGARLSF